MDHERHLTMDLEEWELLPEHGFLDEDGGKKVYSPKRSGVFEMNYFICPLKSVETPTTTTTTTTVGDEPHINQLLPVQIDLGPPKIVAEAEKVASLSDEQDTVSQVFFKKMKETEFVEMKMESPRSGPGRGVVPQLDFQFDEDNNKSLHQNSDKKLDGEDEQGVINNIRKWSLTGIGAIFSFGVVAATFCIISLNSQHIRPKQKLQFQVYTNDQRIQQVVRHASKLNEAISGVRGVAISRAHITVGGYYDASSL
ncbi:dihydroxy-acid dehydratase [Striga asiatica]|uniref:Dihydroxy-acid dehydratase n=1 Tax=Striga asiatica TaxID=4170 RepID=A0A5A7RIX8_STRAF|nr:dihydroxy-acid dehydratase [Striga asiatica]